MQMLCYRQLGSVAGLASTNDGFRTSRRRWSHRSGIVLAASILRKQILETNLGAIHSATYLARPDSFGPEVIQHTPTSRGPEDLSNGPQSLSARQDRADPFCTFVPGSVPA